MDNGLFGVFYFCLGVKLDKKLDMDFSFLLSWFVRVKMRMWSTRKVRYVFYCLKNSDGGKIVCMGEVE